MKQTLKKTGYKMTRPRKLVLDILLNEHNPLSAKEIHSRLKNKIDLASVYRTLQLFEQLGELQREETGRTVLYYLSDEPHHHIKCRICGRVQCVPCNHVFQSIKNFKKVKHQLNLSGVCERCLSK